MFGRFRHFVRRWLEVPVYTSGLEVQFALLNLLASRRFPDHIDRQASLDLLENFFTSGLESPYPGDLSPSEKQGFLHALHRFRTGEAVAPGDFPFLKDPICQVRLGAWLSNLLREDIGAFPRDESTTIPLSVFAPGGDLSPLHWVYQVFDPLGFEQKVVDLSRYQTVFSLTYWHELAPYFLGPVLMLGGGKLLPEDALLVPRIISEFVADPSLGLLSIPDRGLRFLRTRLCQELIVPNLPLRLGLPLPSLERKVRQHGWRVEELWYPAAKWDFGE